MARAPGGVGGGGRGIRGHSDDGIFYKDVPAAASSVPVPGTKDPYVPVPRFVLQPTGKGRISENFALELSPT